MIAVLKLIGKYLWKNKKRNLFIGISIMISAMLLTSVVSVIDDFKNIRFTEIVDRDGGDYDAEIHTKDKEFMINLQSLSMFDSASYVVNVGEPIIINDKFYMQLRGYDDNFNKILNFKLKEGRYPKANDEIALENWIVNNLNPVPKIGDKIKLTYPIKQKTEIKNKDKKVQVSDEFTFVGTFEYCHLFNQAKDVAKAYVTKDYAEGVLKDKGKYADNEIYYDMYVKLKPDTNLKSAKVKLENHNGTTRLNYFRERCIQGIKKFDIIGNILYSIIIVTSTIIIYNMFNSSIIIRMSQIGMLKALGLTPRQIKWLVVGEGIVLGGIFIPLGNILGQLFYKLSMYFISGELNYNIFEMKVKAVSISLICGFVAIFLGTISSIRKVSDISAIEAINCSSYLDIKNVRFKDTKEIGGTSNKFLWDMARCNIKRNKMKFMMSTVSIVIAIILFLLVNYLMNSQSPTYGFKKKFGSDFIVRTNLKAQNIPKSTIDRLEKIEYIKDIEKLTTINAYLNVPKEKLKADGKKEIEDSARRYDSMNSLVKSGINPIKIVCNGYEREKIEKLEPSIAEGKIELDLMDEKPVCILVQNLNYNNVADFKVGDSMDIYGDNNGSIVVGAILKNDNYIKNDGSTNMEFIMSDKAMAKFLKVGGVNNLRVNIKNSKDYEKINKEIKNIIIENPNLELIGYKEQEAKAKNEYFKVGVALGSFIIINALASIVNIFGVMTMNIVLRKKEFSMLRAVGMGNGEVMKLITYEGLIYGGIGGVVGLALGVPLTYLFFILTRKYLTSGMIWQFPLLTIIGVATTVIAVCLLASIISSRKLFKDGIIEGVRAVE